MAGKKGNYSNVVVYDESKRYYYTWAQRNKPFLDDEIRNMGVGLLDQIRRSVQNTFGDVASPYKEHVSSVVSTESFKVKASTTDPSNNFTVTGGTSLDHPAVLYAKGFYIFLTGSIDYKDQMYTGDPDLSAVGDKSKTISPIPSLSTPATDRIDVVYISLKFAEVTAENGTDTDVYVDSNLRNPMVGTETANRLRAVFDIRVKEDWSSTISKNIFTDSFFLGSISDDTNPIDNVYNIPIAAIYRKSSVGTISDDNIIDLISLYNKRVLTLEEMSYRIQHGGYTQKDVDELGYTSFTAQFPGAVVDEGAFATGLNKGLGTEAFNTNAVTPRILDNNGKFFMSSVMVGHDTGLIAYETGPEGLKEGELIGKDASFRSVYVGYGATGITGMREYIDSGSFVGRGVSGMNILSALNMDGETGSGTVSIHAVQDGKVQNFYRMDYKGRIGLNTYEPGWSGPSEEWAVDRYNEGLFGVTGVNIALDINASARITENIFVDGDSYTHKNTYGRSHKIPSLISKEDPALFGFAGMPRHAGFTGHIGSVLFKRGIVAVGETGMTAYGYTGGSFGHYESTDEDGHRLFSIGDLGDEFDRVVKTLYGTGTRRGYKSDYSFMNLPNGYGEIAIGDIVTYDIVIEPNTHITGYLTLTQGGMDGVDEIKEDILNNPLFTGTYERTYQYTYYKYDGTTELRTGEDIGVQVIEDEFGYSLGFDDHGRIVLKDIPESPVNVEIDSIASFTVTRGANPPVNVPFTFFHWYGTAAFGGDVLNVKFAKLDLGEGADAWLFNGDVFFNGNGNLNRVTFSPNVIFRDDVFVYGSLHADQLVFNFVNVNNIRVRNNLTVDGYANVVSGLSVGENTFTELTSLQSTDERLKAYIAGKALMEDLVLEADTTSSGLMGSITLKGKKYGDDLRVVIGGNSEDISNRFGIHLIDSRPGIDLDSGSSFKDLALDYSDGNGNYGNLNLILSGDMSLNRGFIAKYIAAGDVDTINTDYAMYVNGRTLINDTLEVKALRFIGAEAPEGDTDIAVPGNVIVVENAAGEAHNNENILRNKQFTVTERIYLNNKNELGSSVTDTAAYYDIMVGETGPGTAFWGHDTLTYTEDQFDELVAEEDPGATDNEIVVPNILDPRYTRYNFNRVIVATLGTMKIEWIGYAYDPAGDITGDVIQSYVFESPYFRNRNKGTQINWMPGDTRFGDENFVLRVTTDIIDTHPSAMDIFSIDVPLGIFIPVTAWKQYGPYANNPNYRSFVIWYPYENIIHPLNVRDFSNQTDLCGYIGQGWRAGIYPRLVKQERVPFDESIGNNQDRMYHGEWDMDLVIFPPSTGRCANMIGKMYISYVQS